MDKSILQKIFDGEFYPSEDIVPRDPNYRPLSHKVSDEWDYLTDAMCESKRQRMTRLQDLVVETHTMELNAFYWAGFRDGILLIHELFGKGEDKQ